MITNLKYPDPSISDLNVDINWEHIYSLSRSLAKHLVYSSHVPAWRGQEGDIVEDIVQETARRIFERYRKVESGEATPIQSLERMTLTVARNYFIDLRRRDRRLIHKTEVSNSIEVDGDRDDYMSMSEAAIEKVYQEKLFMQLADEIVKFPDKQRRALLIDIANRMCFEMRLTALQEAFLEGGIDLQEYQQPFPDNPKDRGRYLSLLNHAYKRIAKLSCIQRFASVA